MKNAKLAVAAVMTVLVTTFGVVGATAGPAVAKDRSYCC